MTIRFLFIYACVVAVFIMNSAAYVCASSAAASKKDTPAAEQFRAQAIPVEELAEHLERYADNVFIASKVPGMAIALAHGDSIVLEKVYGVRDMDSGEPVTRDTVFPLASLSKGMAGITAALVQVDDSNSTSGFNLDAPLQQQLPWFELADPWVSQHITVADCLSHRTGMPNDTGESLWQDFDYAGMGVFGRFRRLSLTKQFRNDFTYQNYVFSLGAMAASRAAGLRNWDELVRRRIFQPLGMNATTSHAAYMAGPDHATPHILRADGFAPYTLPARPDQTPASGVFASLDDMEHWIRALANRGVVDGGTVLPSEALDLAFQPRNTVSTKGPTATLYGLGWNITFMNSARVVHHQGFYFEGVNTVVALLPDYGLCLVVLTNGFMVGVPGALQSKLVELATTGDDVRNTLGQQMEMAASMLKSMAKSYGRMPPPPDIPRNAAAYERYAGVYASEYWGHVVVGAHGDPEALDVVLGNATTPRPLAHYDGDVFTMDVAAPLAGANATYPTAVEFACADSSPCESVRFARFDMDGGRNGVFQRIATAWNNTPTQDRPRIAMRFGHDAQRDDRSIRVYED